MDREYDLFLRDVRRQVTTHMSSFQKREFLDMVGGPLALKRPDFMNSRALDHLKKHTPEIFEARLTRSQNGKTTTRVARDPDIRRQTMAFEWSITRNADRKVLAQGRDTDRSNAAEALSQARDLYKAKATERSDRDQPRPELTPFGAPGRPIGMAWHAPAHTSPDLKVSNRTASRGDRAKNGWELLAKQNERPPSSPELEDFRRAIAPAGGREPPDPERAAKQRQPYRPKSRAAERAPSRQPEPGNKMPTVEMGDYKYRIQEYELKGFPMARWDIWKPGAERGQDQHLDSGSGPSVSEAEREAQRRIRQFERGEFGREGPPEKTDKPKKREPYRPKNRERDGTQRGGRGQGDDFER